MTAGRKWEGTTFGGEGLHGRLISLLRVVDVRLVYAFSSIFVVPWCLIFGASRKVIYRYLRLRQGYSALKAFWKNYRTHCLFSQAVVDKFAMYAGKKFHTVMVGYEHYLRLEAEDPGFIQLSSHIGNYEIAGYSLVAEHKRMNALVFAGEKAHLMAERNKMLSKDNIRLIPVAPDMSHVFTLSSALLDNEVVSMPADRMFGSEKFVRAQLLGSPVRLPLGPFQLAATHRLKVLAVNAMKTGSKEYTIYVTPLEYDLAAARRDRIEQLAAAYASELERLLRLYPTQWFNFYDFWEQ